MRRILTVGTPATIVNIMQSVCVVLINQFLLPYGTGKIASMGIAIKVNMIALLILTGFAFGGAPCSAIILAPETGQCAPGSSTSACVSSWAWLWG